jgi:Fur family ferric uptake transcriptional regulator
LTPPLVRVRNLIDFDYQLQETNIKQRSRLKEHLSSKGLKMTPQRRVILDMFLDMEGHLSAEELYHIVRQADPAIGQATVYRTVKLLAEAGIAKRVDFGDGITRYEPRYGVSHHDHIVCEKCRRHVEFVDQEIEKLQEKQAGVHGFRLTSHRMVLYGICPDCS